ASARAASRSVVHRAPPERAASSLSLAGFRPTRTGSGAIISPPASTPPSWMMGSTERGRGWLVPMRPVTPFRMTPIRRVLGSATAGSRRRRAGRVARLRGALRLGAGGERRGLDPRAGQRAGQLLAPVGDLAGRPVAVDHLERRIGQV